MAKECAGARYAIKSACIRFVGFGSRALDTTEGVLGLPPGLPSPEGWRGVLRLEGQYGGTIREERVTVSASVDEEIGRACLSSDHENVRGRHESVKAARRSQDPRVVRILDAEKASVQWCAEA